MSFSLIPSCLPLFDEKKEEFIPPTAVASLMVMRKDQEDHSV